MLHIKRSIQFSCESPDSFIRRKLGLEIANHVKYESPLIHYLQVDKRLFESCVGRKLINAEALRNTMTQRRKALVFLSASALIKFFLFEEIPKIARA
jgi:hypothetical protein